MKEETPKETYKDQEKKIQDEMTALVAEWERTKKVYAKQLKEKPDGWSGIGRGGDLAEFLKNLRDMKSHLQHLV